jgi:putative transcriptional regulator
MFLIAIPQLGDPNFARSVVLLLHHGAEGALGLVVNYPSTDELGKFGEEHGLACHSSLRSQTLYRGGPVEPSRGWILHSDGNAKERQEVMPGLYVSVSLETLGSLMSDGTQPFKLLLGYAGWGPGQLEHEMALGSWLTVEPGIKHVLETPAPETWGSVLSDMGVDPTRLAMATGIH